MKVTIIHRVIEFKESRWLEKYIDFNTDKRTKAKNDFEKDLFKLLYSSVYGKTIENLRKKINIKLTGSEDVFTKHAAKASYISGKMFNENLFVINIIKEELVLNRPIYVGMTMLDLSKHLMYDYHYNYMREKYERKKIKLMFTDTDSLLYEIKTEDLFEKEEDRDLFDTSEYKITSKYYSEKNKKKIGKMKDECSGKSIKEFVGLRSKVYAYCYDEECKGE